MTTTLVTGKRRRSRRFLSVTGFAGDIMKMDLADLDSVDTFVVGVATFHHVILQSNTS